MSRRSAGSSRVSAPAARRGQQQVDRRAPVADGSRIARPSRSGIGAGSPAPRESRTTAASRRRGVQPRHADGVPAPFPCRSRTAGEHGTPRVHRLAAPQPRERAEREADQPAGRAGQIGHDGPLSVGPAPPRRPGRSTVTTPRGGGIGAERGGTAVNQRSVATGTAIFGTICPLPFGDTDRSSAYVLYMLSTLLVIGGVLVGLLVLLALIVSLSARPQTSRRGNSAPPAPRGSVDAGRRHPDAWSPLSTTAPARSPRSADPLTPASRRLRPARRRDSPVDARRRWSGPAAPFLLTGRPGRRGHRASAPARSCPGRGAGRVARITAGSRHGRWPFPERFRAPVLRLRRPVRIGGTQPWSGVRWRRPARQGDEVVDAQTATSAVARARAPAGRRRTAGRRPDGGTPAALGRGPRPGRPFVGGPAGPPAGRAERRDARRELRRAGGRRVADHLVLPAQPRARRRRADRPRDAAGPGRHRGLPLLQAPGPGRGGHRPGRAPQRARGGGDGGRLHHHAAAGQADPAAVGSDRAGAAGRHRGEHRPQAPGGPPGAGP